MCLRPKAPPIPTPEIIKPRPKTAKEEGTVRSDFKISPRTGQVTARRQGIAALRLPSKKQ